MYLLDPVLQSIENNPLLPGNRPKRLLKLAELIEGEKYWSGDELAEQFHVCRRTIFRDIQLLRNARVPVDFDADKGGYRIRPNAELIRSQLTSDELVALVIAIKIVGELPETIARPCEQALNKLLASALPEVRNEATRILNRYLPAEESFDHREFPERRHSG